MIVSKQQLEEKTIAIRNEQFNQSETSLIPTLETQGLTFGNSGKYFYATVLYIDIRQSSKLLDSHHYANVAKLLTAFYNAIVRVANQDGGEIRSFNGDSLLVFYKGTENDTVGKAVQSAMKMSFAINNVVNPVMKNLSNIDFGIGIDYGKVLATKVGIGGCSNTKDLIWIGNGVNRATKISDLCQCPYHIGISERLYDKLDYSLKYTKDLFNRSISMWTSKTLNYNEDMEIMYQTNYHLIIQ